MAAVWMRLRSEARARWRSMLGLALLLAIMGGAATAAAVGAYRTETAYPRFAERYRVYDLTIATGRHPRTDEILAIAARLPQVIGTTRNTLYTGSARTHAGKEAAFPDVFFFAETGRDPKLPGVKVVEGRMSDPSAPDEVMVNYAMAERLDLHPGDRVAITLTGQQDLVEDAVPLPPVTTNVQVAGIFAAIGSFETVTGSGVTTVFLVPPAFDKRWRSYHFANEDLFGVLLRRGRADAGAFVADLHRELELAGLGDGLDGDPIGTWVDTPGVQGLNRVPALALAILGGAVALTTLAVFSQLIARESRVASADYPAIYAIGFSRNELMITSTIRSVFIVGIGAFGSALVAYMLSPLTPVGLARIAEPNPGFLFEPWGLGLGIAATLALATVAALPSAWGSARRAADPARRTSGVRPAFLASGLARARLGISIRSGLQMAIDPGRGDRAVPVRTAVLGTSIAVGGLAAALTFAVSLGHLIGDPKLSGYPWDAGAIANAFDPASADQALRRIDDAVRREMPATPTWRGTVFAGAAVDDIEVGAYVSDGPPPSIIDGRAPESADEVAVDPRTLRRLRARIGSRVQVRPLMAPDETAPEVSMRIVGLFAVPRIAFQGINPGQGVALSPSGYARMSPGAPFDTLFVDFPAGTDFDSGVKALREAAGDAAFAIVNRQQSTTVGNVERLSSLPNTLAAIVGVLGVATLLHAVSTTMRRRRRDLAILKTLGFVGRQIRGAVAWQSTGMVVAALLIGLPVGAAAGRWGWRLFAESLQVVPVPVTSALALVAVAAGALVLANVIAVFPAHIAARTEPALVLRTE